MVSIVALMHLTGSVLNDGILSDTDSIIANISIL